MIIEEREREREGRRGARRKKKSAGEAVPRFFFPFSVNPSFLALTPFHLPSSFNQPPFRPPLPPPSPPPTPSALPLAHSRFTPAPSEPENKPESASRTSTERAPPPPRDRESSLPTPGASKENSPKKNRPLTTNRPECPRIIAPTINPCAKSSVLGVSLSVSETLLLDR